MGTILVVHDELNSLELSVFKKDDRSKPELRYFPPGGMPGNMPGGMPTGGAGAKEDDGPHIEEVD